MRVINLGTFILAFAYSSGVFAANYYVKPDGNDKDSGKSHNTAWASIKKVNAFRFNTSDDVYFLSGGIWRSVITIDWSGTKKNRAIFGAYYMKDGKEKIGVSGTRPTLQGNFAGINDMEHVFTSSGIPPDKYDGMIGIGTKSTPQSYVNVQDWKIINSAGRGVVAWSYKSSYNIIQNNFIKHTASAGIATRGPYTIIRKNDVSQSSPLTKYSKKANDGQPCIFSHGQNVIIEDNYVHECWMEGIGSYKNKGYNIVRGNLVVAAKRISIYFSNSENNVAESNKIIGDTTEHTIGTPPTPITYAYSGTGWPGAALQSTSEEWGPVSSDFNYFRNNLVANTSRCIYASVNSAGKTEGFTAEGYFYGNTCVGNKYNADRSSAKSPNSKIFVKNNIFIYGKNNGKKDDCRWGKESVDFQNNYWQEKPLNNACVGEGDVYGGLKLNKTSRWSKVGLNNIPTDEDFLPSNDSIKGLGKALTSSLKNPKKYTQIDQLQKNCKFDLTLMSQDYACNKRTISSDLGAFQSANLVKETIIEPPTNVRLIIKP